MAVLIILNNIYKSLGIEWLTDGLLGNNYDLHFILINDDISEMELFLQNRNIPVTRISYSGKAATPIFLYKLFKEVKRINPDVLHTHLRYADLFGQFTGYLAGVKKRIYTRHSSTFNHLYHKKSVLLDKLVNFLATDIIAISEVTRNVLVNMENVAESKITLIHHGFDLQSFDAVSPQRIINLKSKYQLPDDCIMVGVFARYTKWKGYQYIIPAFAQLKKKYPQLYFIFANTTGEYAETIKQLLADHLTKDSYTEIRFENDIQAFYKLLNVYVHAPVDDTVEAFGQTYIEALAAGVPSVFTLSGIANEFIADKKNALVVAHKNISQIFTAVSRLLDDEPLRQVLVTNGLEDVKQFGLDLFISNTINLYNKKTP